jgi:hypothetical protein
MAESHRLIRDEDGVTLLIHSTWRGRLRLAWVLLRTYADRLFVVFIGTPVLGVVAGVLLGPTRVDSRRLLIVTGVIFPMTLVVLLVLFVLGLKPTFHWMRKVTALRFAPSGVRATLKDGTTIYKGWDWVAGARRHPFGLAIEASDPRWARWFIQQRNCNPDVFSRLEDLLMANRKLPRPPAARPTRRSVIVKDTRAGGVPLARRTRTRGSEKPN